MAASLLMTLYDGCPVEYRKRASSFLRDDLASGLLIAADYLRDAGDEAGADRLARLGRWALPLTAAIQGKVDDPRPMVGGADTRWLSRNASPVRVGCEGTAFHVAGWTREVRADAGGRGYMKIARHRWPDREYAARKVAELLWLAWLGFERRSSIVEAQEAAMKLGPAATEAVVGTGGLSGATQEALDRLVQMAAALGERDW